MNSITRNIRDIGSGDRQALENVLGQPLTDNQRITIQVETLPVQKKCDDTQATKLPDWCNVYVGLSDEEIAEVEDIALARTDMTRPSE